MASVYVVNKMTGKRVRSLDLYVKLESIRLSYGEMLSWHNQFQSNLDGFDWTNRIMEHGDAKAFIECVMNPNNSRNYVVARVEGSDPADVYALVCAVSAVLGTIIVPPTSPTRNPTPWQKLKAWLKVKVDTYGDWPLPGDKS